MNEDTENLKRNVMGANNKTCPHDCENVTEITGFHLKPPDTQSSFRNYLSKSNNSDPINLGTLLNVNESLSELYSLDRTTNETFSGTNCTFENSTCSEISDYNWWALSLLVFPLLTLFGNVLVIMSVTREKSLQTATNYFIVSLAVADLLVAVVVMPFGVYYLFNGGVWGLPSVMCDCYIAMDVTCSTSSIFNLVAISVDRYIAVTQPIKYAKHKSNGRVWTMIGVAWLVSGAIGSPVVLGLNNTPDRSQNQCLFNNTDYIIYSSLGSFYIPCIIMMFLYFSIFKAIRLRAKKQRSAKKVSYLGQAVASGTAAVVIENVARTQCESGLSEDRPTNTASGSNEDEDDENFGKTEIGALAEELNMKSARFMLAAVVEETGLIMANLASPIPMMDPTTNNDSGYAPSNMDVEKEHSPPASPINEKGIEQKNDAIRKPEIRKKLSRISSNALISTPRKRFRSAATAARFTIFRANRAGKLRAKSFAKKEKKATQTLAIVLGVFLFCWAPFFTCNVLDAICTKFGLPCSPGVTVFILTTWLGYINSFLNPVIYTIFNPEFRKAFRKILRCGP